MAISRIRLNGNFAPLSAKYFQDDRIGEAGPLAELLYVRALAYCSGSFTDGFMTERQVLRFVAADLDNVEDLCKTLVAVGLWVRDDERGGYQIRNYLKWNRSCAEIYDRRSADAARKARERESARSPSGVRADSKRSPSGVQKESADLTNKQTTTDRTSGSVRSVAQAPDARPIAATPPDLSELREKLSDSSRSARTRSARRATGS